MRPLQSSLILLIAGITLCFGQSTALAIVVFDNGVQSKSGGFLSDVDASVRFADDFTLAAPELVNAIRFWGFYSPTDTPPATDAFNVVFYANSGGLPNGSSVIASYNVGNPGRTDTGDDTDGGGLNIYVYDATFADHTFPAGHYWVSVYNNTSGDANDNWAWARHALPGNDARSLDGGATWLHEFSDSELAFQLIQVPEPSTIALALVALGGLQLIAARTRARCSTQLIR